MRIRLTVTYEAEVYSSDPLRRGADHVSDLKLPQVQQWGAEGTTWFLKSIAVGNAEGEQR